MLRGCGGLTKALRARRIRCDTPYEAFPSKHVYVQDVDLDRDDVFADLLTSVIAGFYLYIHFGLVCTSWGHAGRLSGGTRRLGKEYGNPTSPREHRGNIQAARVSMLCHALV